MPTQQFNISIDIELLKRFTSLVGLGKRTRRICELMERDWTEMESKQIEFKAKKIMFEKYYKPFILKYADGRDPFYLLEHDGLRLAFKKANIKISDEDIKLCIEQILIDGEE